MPIATINGIKINYLIKGTGPHVLMFAPGGFNSAMANWTAKGGMGAWKDMDALDTLSQHFTVIAYDRRECGLSGGRVEPLNWDVYVREAKGVLDLAQAPQAYVLGACMGVALATAFAARHPTVCKGLLLHSPVGGYQWMSKGRTFFNRHIEFARANGLAAVTVRAPEQHNFWKDPEGGPWASTLTTDPEFAAHYVKQDVGQYLEILARSRDALFSDTMPSGATGEQLMAMKTPALITSGGDAVHTISASWALKELMPNAERWDVPVERQNGRNMLEQILKFKARLEAAA